jgi:predicted component of type VI protein secretion system
VYFPAFCALFFFMSARIVAISGPLKNSVFPLGDYELRMGRDPNVDVYLDDPAVSRRHCSICPMGDRYSLVTNVPNVSTFVNGFWFPVKSLTNGDRIRVGSSVFVFLDQDDQDGSKPHDESSL